MIYWMFLLIPSGASGSSSSSCVNLPQCMLWMWMFKVIMSYFHRNIFFFSFVCVFCLSGCGCHEKMMSITNNKTDMFTEDWRAGVFLASILILWDQKVWQDEAWTELLFPWNQKSTNVTNQELMMLNLHLTCLVSGFYHVLHLTACKALIPKASLQVRPHTDIYSSVHSNVHSLITVWPWTHLNYMFPPLLPSALSFIIIKVRFMSQILGEVMLHS